MVPRTPPRPSLPPLDGSVPPACNLIRNPGNRGKGYTVRNGLLQAAGEIVLFSDADLSSPMEEANLFDGCH